MIEQFTLINPVNNHDRMARVCPAADPVAVMIIVHGFGEHSGRYQGMMEHLAKTGIASIAIDLEGHGLSGLKRGVCRSYDILLADVDLLASDAAKRFPNIPVFLYGHSMGGGLALHHVLKNGAGDFYGVIVSAPLIHPADPVPGPLRAIVKCLRPVLPNMTIANTIPGEKVSTLPDEQARYEQDPLNHDRLGIGLAADIIEGGEWVSENSEKWTAPLLLMHARADKLTKFESSEAFAAKAANCTFRAMPDCEHEMHNDVCRDTIYAEMIRFMKDRL